MRVPPYRRLRNEQNELARNTQCVPPYRRLRKDYYQFHGYDVCVPEVIN